MVPPGIDKGNDCPAWMRISSPRHAWEAVPYAAPEHLCIRSRKAAITPDEAPAQYVTIPVAAEATGYSASHLKLMCRRGEVRAVLTTAGYMVDLDDVAGRRKAYLDGTIWKDGR
jgi:hypothetical protein